MWDGGDMPPAVDPTRGYSKNYPFPGTPLSSVDPKISWLWRPDGPEGES